MEEDIKLIILMNSEGYWKNVKRSITEFFSYIGEDELSFAGKGYTLLYMVSWKRCGGKEGGGEFLYNNLEKL